MPFSLTNVSVAFQQFMNNIFSNFLDVCVMIYLDDILIYLNNMSKHHQHVKEVLKHFHKASFYTKAEKCEFHSESVEYLGYILSPSGLTISNYKVKIIQDWPEPKKVKDIQSFLGFANFYCQFIFNYLDIVILLIHLTWKDIPWKFDSSCWDAFNFLKKVFTSTPILTHWIPDAQLIMETDASDYALTAILSIVNDDNEIHPVSFHSCTFTTAELNYNTYDKELLAIFKAFKIWQHYLEGLAYSINVVMDHKNLEYFSTTKVLTQKQARWSKYLSQFNLVIRFRPGCLGTKPDALTRRWDVYPKGGNTGYATVNSHNFKPIFTQEQLAASIRATVLLFPSLCAATVVDLDTLHQDILLALPSNPIATKHTSADSQWSMDPNGLLFLNNRIYVPSAGNLHTRVLQYNHDHILARHFGQNKTLELVCCGYSWPSLYADIQQFCKFYVPCMWFKLQCHKPYGSLKQLPIPERPWNSISIDFIEKLLSSSRFDTILVIVDQLTKQAIFISAHDIIMSTDLAHLFVLHVFSKHGVPSHIISNRGLEFVSNFFWSLGTALNMWLYFTSDYHPEGDGQTKRTNQTLKQYLYVYCNYQQDN